MTSPYGQQMVLPDVILSEKPYPIKAMIISGNNPVAAWPDSHKLTKAFKKLDMLVVMDLFMTETAKLATIVLPACSSLETLGLAHNYGLVSGMPYVMLSRRVIEPLGECWPDWKFYSELARKMGYGEYFPWNTDEEVVEHFLQPSGITMKQLLEENPEGVWFGKKCYDINAPKQIRTPSGKMELYSQSLADAGYDPIPVHKEPSQSPIQDPELAKEYPLILVTGVRIPEYTHWQMKNIPELRQLAPEAVAEVHPATAREYDVADGDMMLVETKGGQIKVKASVTEDLKPGVVSLIHGWEGELNENVLTQMEPTDPVTGYAEFRNIACRIKKV